MIIAIICLSILTITSIGASVVILLQSRNQRQNSTELAKQNKLAQEQITQKLTQLKDLDQDISNKNTKLEGLEEAISEIIEKINLLTPQITTRQAELAAMLNQHKEATKRLQEEIEGRMLGATEDDRELARQIQQLKLQFPRLKDALSKLEWTEIWQPKFKTMTNDLLSKDQCGIYRIFIVDEQGTRSYVGQAKKIRERWSQHIKKMVGVDKADNQKFYSNITPADAHFEIIEECSEKELNEKEHYWIDYYNCVEDGFNSKQ